MINQRDIDALLMLILMIAVLGLMVTSIYWMIK